MFWQDRAHFEVCCSHLVAEISRLSHIHVFGGNVSLESELLVHRPLIRLRDGHQTIDWQRAAKVNVRLGELVLDALLLSVR